MEKKIEVVRAKLRQKVLQGYEPYYSPESAEDHWIDWLQLSRTEFDAIVERAKREREALEGSRRT
jgi:hypothetical protein